VPTKLKIVTQLPLRGLWNDYGSLEATRKQDLSSAEVRELLRSGEVQFVVIDVGLEPRWIELNDCYRFWMDEVQHHLIEPDDKAFLDHLPGCYGYRASEWRCAIIAKPIVALERCH
jgi:hypothetical protein